MFLPAVELQPLRAGICRLRCATLSPAILSHDLLKRLQTKSRDYYWQCAISNGLQTARRSAVITPGVEHPQGRETFIRPLNNIVFNLYLCKAACYALV